MFHFFNAITNTSGDSLIGYFGRVIDVSTQGTVDIFADESGTPISVNSGVANMAVTDNAGNMDFYVEPGTYHLDLYSSDAATFIRRIKNVAMNSTKGDRGDKGDTGETGLSNNTRLTLADLKAAAITDKTSLYDGSLWTWTPGDFTGKVDDINIVKADSTPINMGAWVRNSPRRADLSASSGSSLVGYIQSGTGAVNRTTLDKLREIVSVIDFGAKGDGATDDTSAFQKSVNYLATKGGGEFYIPAGTYITGTIHYPYDPVSIRTYGAGPDATILQQRSPTEPVFAIDPTSPPNRMTGAIFERLGVKAHASADPTNLDHIAINTIGFDHASYRDIRLHHNGTGGFGIGFYSASYPHLTYNQRFVNIAAYEGVGPGYVIKTGFDANPAAVKGGSSYLRNTNVISIESPWIYSNSQMKSAFDMKCCTGYSIKGGLIESTGDYGIELGSNGQISGIWIESVAVAPLRFSTAGTVTSSGNIISGYLSGYGGSLSIPVDCTGNVLLNLRGGSFTVNRADPQGGNVIIGGPALGGDPTIAQSFGTSVGTITKTAGLQTSLLDGMRVMVWTFTPPAGASYGFQVTPPAGYAIKRLFASAYDAANGVAVLCASGYPLGNVSVTTTNTNQITLAVQVAYE